jgi:CHAD domain-containing protein
MAIDRERIQKSLSKLRKFAEKTPKQPSPGEIHKLRTHARKIETTFQALSQDSGKNERQLLNDIGKIRKRAGKIRDLDVLTGKVSGIHLDGETECEIKLLEYLGSERRKQSAKLRSLISKERTALIKRLRRASTHMDKFLKKQEPQPAALAAANALQLSYQLDSPRRLNRRNLHRYRLKVKHLRYVLQLSPSADPKFVDDLGHVKDAIGDWHDSEELISIASDMLNHGAGCRLIAKLKEISESKYQSALGRTEDLRNRYLKTRARKKPTQPVELKPEVLDATAKLARSEPAAA